MTTMTDPSSPDEMNGNPESSPNQDDYTPHDESGESMGDAGSTGEPASIEMGQAMPQVGALPVLSARAIDTDHDGSRLSTIAKGMSFTGRAAVAGSVTVAGEVQGDLDLGAADAGHVTVTETGTVVGDIRARNISVLGQTVGTLDASYGKVSLHSTASVSGHIRYTHLQVNGADLNAQLERVRPDAPRSGEPH